MRSIHVTALSFSIAACGGSSDFVAGTGNASGSDASAGAGPSAGQGGAGQGGAGQGGASAAGRSSVVGVSLGDACDDSTPCVGGLVCEQEVCELGEGGDVPIDAGGFPAAACADPVESGETVRALFELTGAEGALAEDFFASPWPSDARLDAAGHPDLDGFPTPGDGLLGFDPVQRYVDAVAEKVNGWGGDPVVIFRFTGGVDTDTLSEGSRVWWYDITPGADTYGANGGLIWTYQSGRTNAVCSHWLGVRRHDGAPLLPGHTYAVYITTGVKAADGSDIERSPGLRAMLRADEPADSALTGAWERFAPFRAFIDEPGLPEGTLLPTTATILNAAVITVGELLSPMERLAQSIAEGPAPEATDWVKCDEGVASPCPQAEGDRACGEGAADYDEYHALVELPIYQRGEAPYSDAGGEIADEPVRHEAVCMALSVPQADAPDAGWPLVVYAHGTGGSFRSHLRDEVSGALSRVALPDEARGMAVLGIDQVEHGPRRGDSEDSPDDLYYNFTNPGAALGNPLQGAADQLSLARLAESLVVPASATGDAEVAIDPSALVFFGHSQGASQGSLALPFSPFSAAVLSGNGASIRRALLTKTRPVDVAGLLPIALGDVSIGADGKMALAGGEWHPGLTLLSHWIDPADPLHFARLAAAEPSEVGGPKHVLVTYGPGDSYSPPLTIANFARAGRFGEAPADEALDEPDELSLLSESLPVSENFSSPAGAVTAVLRQYAPAEGSDGHFVVFENSLANADALHFLADAVAGQSPTIVE